MKPRNREVSIFNMSVLDLLTGALGAFCFLTLALFPNYFKAQTETEKINQLDRSAAALAKNNDRLKEEIAKEKAAGKEMPAFALMQLSTSDRQNNDCAKLSLISVGVPAGSSPMGYREAGFGYYLFAINSGTYHIQVQADITQPTECTVSLTTLKDNMRQVRQQIRRSKQLQFDYQVMDDDFSKNLFD